MNQILGIRCPNFFFYYMYSIGRTRKVTWQLRTPRSITLLLSRQSRSYNRHTPLLQVPTLFFMTHILKKLDSFTIKINFNALENFFAYRNCRLKKIYVESHTTLELASSTFFYVDSNKKLNSFFIISFPDR